MNSHKRRDGGPAERAVGQATRRARGLIGGGWQWRQAERVAAAGTDAVGDHEDLSELVGGDDGSQA